LIGFLTISAYLVSFFAPSVVLMCNVSRIPLLNLELICIYS